MLYNEERYDMRHMIPEAVQEYLSAYRYKIELHAHTSPCSGCSEIPPREMIRLMKEQNYDVVVITNHFCDNGRFMQAEDPVAAYLEDYRIAREEGEKQGIRVLLGAEYHFTENSNDYLVYGVDEEFLRETVEHFDMGIEAFYQKYHGDSRLILQAHPFRNGMVWVSPKYLDGAEIMNLHASHNSRVAVTANYANAILSPKREAFGFRPGEVVDGKTRFTGSAEPEQETFENFSVVTVGTDLHHWGHEGACALRTKVLPENEEQLVEILRSGDYIFDIGGYPMLPYCFL